jgi:hypothetical protein
MLRTTSSTNVIATIGIDIGKNTFHVIALDDKGAIILRHKLETSAREISGAAATKRYWAPVIRWRGRFKKN